ncbi:MAG TPA: sulfatase-like hydrolase/transferase [Planctomycetota bacterium]|nr:sulfatase-like hydrolase/transferase [Planctomycetota bacterium]
MSKPNVVVILCDQLRAFEVGCYGNAVVRTPNIDKLAAEGVRFDVAVTNNPVCTPARSCLITGQHSRTCTGEVGNVADDPAASERLRLRDTTLAEALKAHGYATAAIGKWHIHPRPEIVGFDHAYYPLVIHRYMHQRYWQGTALGSPVDEFAAEHEINKVEHWVAAHRTKPFFLFYSISQPHEPIGWDDMPERYLTMYRKEDMPLRPNVWQDGKMAHSEHWFKVYTIWDYFWRKGGPCWGWVPEGYPTDLSELETDRLPEGFDLRDLTALYYGATTCVDDYVGRMMQILRDNRLLDNTVVVFTSDHGDNLGSHQLFNKDCLFEESIRIPLVVWYPASIAPQSNAAQIAQLIDLMPTVLDLCGIEAPPSVQGRSLGPVLRRQCSELPDNVAFIETDQFFFKRPCIGIRTPTHLYGLRLDEKWDGIEDEWGFYDVARDPCQFENLAGTAKQEATREQLHRRLTEWNASTPWLQT